MCPPPLPCPSGGVPSVWTDAGEIWYCGAFMWLLWMAATAWQFVTSLSAAAALVFGFVSFAARYYGCM